MRLTIDGQALEVEQGATVLEAIRSLGKQMPTLCYDPRLAPYGACRVCLVGAAGAPGPIAACTTPCREGMAIDTRDETARRVATAIVELVLSELPEPPAAHSELGGLARELGIATSRWPAAASERDQETGRWPAAASERDQETRRWPAAAGRDPRPLRWTGAVHDRREDLRHPYLALRHELCISCGRCVRACDEIQGAFALTVTGRGFDSNITAGLDAGFRDSACVSCGACADTCPTEAITERALLDLARSAQASGVAATDI